LDYLKHENVCHRVLNVQYKDLEISRLAAYWPAPIHAVALLAYTVVT